MQLQSVKHDRIPQSATVGEAKCVQTKPPIPVKGNKSKENQNRRRKRRSKEINITMMGNNANSLVQKLESLEHILCIEKPSVIFLQETKLGRIGRIKTPSSLKYTWYELHRTINAIKGPKGGGIALGVLNVLEPSWVSEGNDEIEAITVEVWIEGFPIRLVCGYGPQESDNKERKEMFWKYLNKETQDACAKGAGFILQMDGNLWAGGTIISGDPNRQNQNGKFFENYLLKIRI